MRCCLRKSRIVQISPGKRDLERAGPINQGSPNPRRTAVGPVLGTNYLEFEWFVPTTGLRLAASTKCDMIACVEYGRNVPEYP